MCRTDTMFHSWESAGDPGFHTVGCWDHFTAVCKAKSSFDSLCGENVAAKFCCLWIWLLIRCMYQWGY